MTAPATPQACFGTYGRGEITMLDRLMSKWK
jgi:hypothetical protein